MPRARTKPRVRLRALFVWHRYLGLIATALVLVLAVTGLALNHTRALQLDQRHVDNKMVLRWYGIETPRPGRAYRSSGHTILRIGDGVYVNDNKVGETSEQLVGAVDAGAALVVAAAQTVWLLTHEGQLIERLDQRAGIPGPLRALGLTPDGRAAVRTAEGVYIADATLLSWSPGGGRGVRWARAVEPSDKLVRTLARRRRGQGLTAERVMLDVHSGRILGPWGPYVMDGAALLMVLLAGTGTWMWYRNWRGRRRRKR